MLAIGVVALGLFILEIFGMDEQPVQPVAVQLRTFTEAPARLTWIRQVEGNGNDPFCWGSQLVVMGLDTEDGRGERQITGEVANYHRPMLSPDGKHVVFSRLQTREAFVVNWEGGEPRCLGEGYAAAVWQDPATGTTWVYLADNGKEGWEFHNARALYRVRMEDPSIRERVWDRAPFTIDNLQLSADGTRFCAQFPHPRAGFADLLQQSWIALGRGCWTSMAPDNSYLVWIFDGPHRNVTITDPVTETAWRVPINTAPGMDGFEVYHPRWSNHRRFFSLTGPYRGGRSGANLIEAGGPDVNVWIGKFAMDLKSVESWLQMTDDRFGNFYPDLWIEKTAATQPQDLIRKNGEHHLLTAPTYPPGLVMKWENANAANDAGTQRWDAESHGRAFWGPFGEMELDGGCFKMVTEGKPEANSGNPTGDFTLEMVVRSRLATMELPATIVVNRGPSGQRWILEQIGNNFLFQFLPGDGEEKQVLDFGTMGVNRPTHLMVVCRENSASVWRDGQRVGGEVLLSHPPNWHPELLWVGRDGPLAATSAWKGRVEGMAMYERALTDEEIAVRHDAVTARLSNRSEPLEVDVIVRLDEALASPPAASILPYHRALLAQVFTVESASAGSSLSPGDEIAVAHWTVLDGEAQPRTFKNGERYRLRITPFKDRPLLESERIFLDADFVLLPVFYEIEESLAL